MTQYSLATGQWSATTLAAQVGGTYNVGLSDGTRYYGYLLQNNGAQTKGLIEKTDVASKEALVNYGSPNLVDRDLTYFPRVSQGDFSGGGLQSVFTDPTKYFDSDLEVRFPGYLQLRQLLTASTLAPTNPAGNGIVAFNGQYWASATESNFHLYNFSAGSSLTTNTGTILASFLTSDGYGVYYSNGAAIARWVTSETIIANTVQGTLGNLWVIENATGQYFVYYSNTAATPNALWKVDLSNAASFPIVAASHVQVPTGGMNLIFVDVVPYENGLAILTSDPNNSSVRSTVWFHDGTNMTRIVTLDGYLPLGMVNCLGDLYFTASATTSPGGGGMLGRVSSGVYSVAAEFAPTLSLTLTSLAVGRPVASEARVFFAIANATVRGIATNYVGIYDTATGGFSHGPATPTGAGSAYVGRSVAVVGHSFATIATTRLSPAQVTIATQDLSTTATYQGSGWMVSSNLDFSTPAIAKRFRTIQVHHAPLAAGEALTLNGYVDLDPTAFTTSLTPTATTSNSTVGSTTTTLSFGANVAVGHMLYYALQLTCGTSNLTSPKINYVAVEVGGTWTWELDLACTSQRRTLSQNDDNQGVTGKDLYFLLRNAYENGQLLTLYLAENVTYTVTIESLEAQSPSYVNKPGNDGGSVLADQEWLVHTVLRQVA